MRVILNLSIQVGIGRFAHEPISRKPSLRSSEGITISRFQCEVFRAARTIAFRSETRRQGFDYWKVLECTHDYNNSLYYADGPKKLKWEGYDAIEQTHDAQGYLESHANSDKPFLLWLAWGPPHNSYNSAPAKYRAMFSPDKMILRDNVPDADRAAARKELAGYYAH